MEERAGQSLDASCQGPEQTSAIGWRPMTDAEKAEMTNLCRERWLWRLAAVVFLLPTIFFMNGPHKRMNEARDRGDIASARKALASIRTSGLVAVVIGIPILCFYISDRFY